MSLRNELSLMAAIVIILKFKNLNLNLNLHQTENG